MTRVFVARHGEPERSEQGSRPNWPLSRFGRDQAEHLAQRLLEFAPLNIGSGPARCCAETAEFASRRLGKPVKLDLRFAEIAVPLGVGDFEAWLGRTFGRQSNTTWTQLDASSNKWRNDNIQAVRDLTEDAVILTHHANINVIMGAALRVDLTAVCRPDHASLTEFSVVNGDIRLVVNGKEVVGPNE